MRGMEYQGYKETLEGDRCVRYFDCGDVFICPTYADIISNYTLYVKFIVCQSYPNKMLFKNM